ncbi:hypothetical protein Cni_G04718 [Canna indica]|uniref:Uncharacterized protein n=1 Tax=Canna indica TaxID=4628 RepID=A0AAQ3JWE5_9LILI|nr:hypothetical protein Cni_G04718 [Canna indica]
MATMQSDIPSSPIAEVGDNFHGEFYRPVAAPIVPDACSIEQDDESDTESGIYKQRRAESPKSENYCKEEEDECSNVVSSNDDEEEVVEKPEAYQTSASKGHKRKRGVGREERSVKSKKDTREEDRAFWELCLAYGYP